MIGRAAGRPARDQLASLRERLGALDRHADRLLEGLSEAELVWRPADGWGVAQVFEHLSLANEAYLEPMRVAVREAGHGGPPGEGLGGTAGGGPSGSGVWRASLLGRFLAGAAGPRARMRIPAPPRFRPDPEPRPDALLTYRRQLAELARLVLEAGDVDLERARVTWPFCRWVRLNLGDAFEIVIGHAERHMAQVDRILERPERPRAAEGPRAPSWPDSAAGTSGP